MSPAVNSLSEVFQACGGDQPFFILGRLRGAAFAPGWLPPRRASLLLASRSINACKARWMIADVSASPTYFLAVASNSSSITALTSMVPQLARRKMSSVRRGKTSNRILGLQWIWRIGEVQILYSFTSSTIFDLPLKIHPAAFRVSGVCMPGWAGFATGQYAEPRRGGA